MEPSKPVDGDTRHRILLLLLRNGAMSAADIAEEFDFSTAGVRRHLDNIVADGLAEAVDAHGPVSEAGRQNSSGSPTKVARNSGMITTPWLCLHSAR